METTLEHDIVELVIARLQALSEDVEISIGSDGEFTRDELITHVRQGDEVGQKIIDLEMSFLRSLKRGSFYDDTPDHASQV